MEGVRTIKKIAHQSMGEIVVSQLLLFRYGKTKGKKWGKMSRVDRCGIAVPGS